WISVAPGLTSIVAVHEPSAPTIAATLLTITFLIGVPSLFGATVPVTVTAPARSRMKLRSGDVTFRTGGSFSSSSESVQAEARRPRLVARSRVRMAGDALQQGRGQVTKRAARP